MAPPISSQARLIERIESIATPNTLTPTRTSGLSVYTWTAQQARTHLVYRPSLCVLLRGEKVAVVGGRSFEYDATRFFFTAVPLPAELIVRPTTAESLVGLVLELDVEFVARVSLAIEDAGSEPGHDEQVPASSDAPSMMFSADLTPRLVETLDRLMGASLDPIRHQVLHQGLLQEVVFELLVGPNGPALRASLDEHGKLRPLIDVMRYMEQNASESHAVPDLASRAGMSESGFYARFRDTTGTTPLQYLKLLRLSQARVQLAAGAESVTEVAFDVDMRAVRNSVGTSVEPLAVRPASSNGDHLASVRCTVKAVWCTSRREDESHSDASY